MFELQKYNKIKSQNSPDICELVLSVSVLEKTQIKELQKLISKCFNNYCFDQTENKLKTFTTESGLEQHLNEITDKLAELADDKKAMFSINGNDYEI